ncbi:apolipoprotein N-acyltransferase [Methylibium sp.]|uniref:apolipoprotein N-acyltransferase n=1 Tax=Methylibium sp. TaxID=2067992 RepID=UPI003D133A72
MPLAKGAAGRRRPLWAELLLAAAAGGLHAFSFAPQDAGWLQLAGVVLLAWRAGAQGSATRAALLGGAFSTAWLAGGVWWLFISLHRYGGLPAWLAVAAIALLCAFLSLYLAAAMAAWVRWRPRSPWRGALLFAALWLLAELARGVLFTGFPWVAAGYAHSDSALAGLAPWLGVYGIGAVSAGIAALAAAALVTAGRVRWTLAAVALAVWWAPLALPQRFTEATGTLSVALLQGNVAQDEKFASERQPEDLAWTLRALIGARADLVIAPETAIPLLPSQLPEGLWDGLRNAFSEGERAALVGLPLGDPQAGYTNSVAGLSRDAAALPGGAYRYDKHHLVPFGEFIPLGFRWFVDLMNMPLGDFNRGPLVAPSFGVKGERVAPNICYEDLFGEELAARFAGSGDAPTILANVSNIAWFGESVAIDQHLQISRLRSLELQRPMLRATNTGATVIIDHRGQVTRRLAPHTRGVLEGPVQGRSGLTPFAWWAGRFGLWPLLLAALALFAATARRRPHTALQSNASD